MTETFRESFINERYPIRLPEHRVRFHEQERPQWEWERLVHLHDRVEPGMTVWDIGAECGDFSCLYRGWVGPEGECVPFEPSLPYWPAIRQTWEANDHPPPAFTFPGFASNKTLLGPGQGITSGWPDASIGEIQPDYGFRHLRDQARQNHQITLTDFALETGVVPDVVVMDIEGSEYRACEGAKDLFAEARPLLYVSVHVPTMLAWYGKTLDNLNDLLASVGYSATLLADPGNEAFWFFE